MKNWQIILLVVLALAIVGLLIQNKLAKKRKGEEEEEETQEQMPECPNFEKGWVTGETLDIEETDNNLNMDAVIKIGDYSQEVLYAQQRINSQYGGAIAEDGKFGCETFYAVTYFTGYDSVEGFELNDLK